MSSRCSRPLTAAGARAYVAGGGTECPWCGGDDLSGGPPDVDCAGAWQDVACRGCGAIWRDVYALVGVDRLDEAGQWLESLDGSPPPAARAPTAAGAPARPVVLRLDIGS